ncbi:zinc finger HIT domain-containing protein 3 [Corythoichthys intestinalis]|uniref:zinc finger HIT domain-containing protein 3 n=1 Tax=Corythoichthys intestinalis TaxID=161448 RepID=UPI0025A62F22|nr:zinc finger HIT domain-containing protein 3 [Corythoichthys intestinalis]XP_061801611.1 zinc finger HIT domain-containing protein 3-like [Nerophis lumbriciformis]
MQLCKVCSEQTPKYKCPACEIRYCSLPCYKRHKDLCLPVEKLPPNAAKDAVCTVADTWSIEDLLHKEDIADVVPLENLQLLGQSKELKDLLCNPHLRELLRAIDSANNKEEAMKAAMQEPLFVEFSDQCLKVVEKEDP